MVPILNPNYNYEKLLKEIEAAGKLKNKVNEDAVELDGETVGEDFEMHLIQHIQE